MIKSKEILAKLAADHYYFVLHQVPVRQDNLFRTYLWIAASNLTLSSFFLEKTNSPLSLGVTRSLYFSILTALGVILFCLFHMRGKSKHEHPDLKAYVSDITGDNEETKLTHLVEQYWEFSEPGKQQMVRRSSSLRITTWGLTCSLIFLALAGVLFCFDKPPVSVGQPGKPITTKEQPIKSNPESQSTNLPQNQSK